jgi:hypothetical protein
MLIIFTDFSGNNTMREPDDNNDVNHEENATDDEPEGIGHRAYLNYYVSKRI